jgi:hypothetical protein
MVTRGGRKQQRKKAAAAEKVAEETTAASTAAQAAEETAAASTAEQPAGTVVTEEADMARGVSVAEAATTELEVVAETATEGSRTRGTPEEMVEAAVVRAARASGSEAKSLAVRRAVEIVIVESMQVGGVEAAREEIARAVQAMGWAVAEAAIMEVVQTMVDERSVIYLPAARWKMSNIFFACGGLPLRGHFVTTLWQCAKKAHDIRFVHINYMNGLRPVPPLGNVVNVCI